MLRIVLLERLKAWFYRNESTSGLSLAGGVAFPEADTFSGHCKGESSHRLYMSAGGSSQAGDVEMPALTSSQVRAAGVDSSSHLVMPSEEGPHSQFELRKGQGVEGSSLALAGGVHNSQAFNSQALVSKGLLGRDMVSGSLVQQSSAVSSSAVELLAVAPIDGIPHVSNADAMEVFVRQAKTYIQSGQWDEARVACGAALSVAPDMAEAYKQVGNLYQEAGRGAEALGFYGRALLVNPEFPEVYANLGSFCARQGEWLDAEKYYRKAIALRPDFAPFYKPLARVLEASGRLSESTDVLVQAVALDADASGAEHYRAGQLLVEQGNEEQAVECFRKAVEAKEPCMDACQPLADLLEKQGDWQTATIYYRKAFEAGLAAADSQAGDGNKLVGAEAGAARLISNSSGNSTQSSLSPASPRVTRIPARAKASPGNPRIKVIRSQSTASVEPVVPVDAAVSPSDEPPAAESTQIDDAIAAYKESLRINPNQPDVYRSLARALTQANRIKDAAQAWFKAFEIEPTWATAEQHCNLGSTLQNQGHLQQALICYQQAVRLNPELSFAQEQLVSLQEKQGVDADSILSSRGATQTNEGAVTVKK